MFDDNKNKLARIFPLQGLLKSSNTTQILMQVKGRRFDQKTNMFEWMRRDSKFMLNHFCNTKLFLLDGIDQLISFLHSPLYKQRAIY